MKNANVWLTVGILAGLGLWGCGGEAAKGSSASTASSASSTGSTTGAAGTASGSTSGAAGSSGTTGASGTTGVNGSGSSSGSSGSSSGSTTGTPFVPGPHEAFPQVPNNDTAHRQGVLASVQLITITYDNDPQRAAVESFGDWIVGSDWLATVGADYGVGKGSHFGKVHLTGNAPTTVNDNDIGSFIASKIADNTLPAPDATLTNPLYVIYYPEGTTITGQTGQSCQTYGGYHTSDAASGKRFAYAVLPTCRSFRQSDADVLAYTEEAMSHELIEAATDPYPMEGTTFSIDDYNNPWAFIPGEVGDLCVGHRMTVPDGFTVQRIWSNSAAAAGGDPCIPVPAGLSYYNVTATPANQTIYAGAGSTVTFNIQGWSTADVGSWFVQAQTYTGSFDPAPNLSRYELSNNQTATLTLQIPAGTPHQSYAMVGIYSSKGGADYNFWPVAVIVP